MAQHFLLSRAAKTLSLAQVFRLSIEEAELTFRKLRWADTNGAPVCPSCGSLDAYGCRRPSGVLRFRCKGCKKDFTVTSGTLFASHKLPLKSYLAAIAVFCNEVKGKSALALSRDLGLSYKTAFVLLHKFREAMAEEMKGRDPVPVRPCVPHKADRIRLRSDCSAMGYRRSQTRRLRQRRIAGADAN